MMFRSIRQYCAASVFILAFAQPLHAHHSGAEYDTSKQIQLVGTVKEFHWANPHVWIDINANDGAEAARDWHIEAGSLGMMARTGWTRSTVTAGDKITIVICPSRSGDMSGALVKITLADGRVMGGGAPAPALPIKQ